MTTTATFSGRVRKPWQKKINPLWLVSNDDDPVPPAWYHGSDKTPPLYQGPQWPEWRRFLTWHVIRNPFHNLAHFVIGVKDRNYTVVGTGPTTDKLDIGKTGWCWCVIRRGPEICLPLPYVSYTGRFVNWHIGWMWDGAFGCRIIPA